MADFAVFKRRPNTDPDALPQLDLTSIVLNKVAGEPESALPDGFTGDGDYVVLRWDSRLEVPVASGPPVIVEPE